MCCGIIILISIHKDTTFKLNGIRFFNSLKNLRKAVVGLVDGQNKKAEKIELQFNYIITIKDWVKDYGLLILKSMFTLCWVVFLFLFENIRIPLTTQMESDSLTDEDSW